MNTQVNLQLPALQIPLLSKSLDLTLSQNALQDRTLVLSPSPHVLLQDDHSPHELYSGGPGKTGFVLIYLLKIKTFNVVIFVKKNKKREKTTYSRQRYIFRCSINHLI